ncbi:Ig-like domain-containing protein [Asticcacaulis sp. W401b]|uniref:Ig-like domain-containing protein n=1 Tax=Asticcacaulis sp. W401b TaxID=3388666 RepID=UPI0039708E1D
MSRFSNVVLLSMATLFSASAQAQTTAYSYDELGRVVTVTHPSSVVNTYSYDRADNRVKVNNRPPVCTPNGFDTTPYTSYYVDASMVCTDPDGDPLIFTVASGGPLILTSGINGVQGNYGITFNGLQTWTYYSNTITFTVTDGFGGFVSSEFYMYGEQSGCYYFNGGWECRE